MSRYFMYGTSLGGIEQLMMLAPNFPQRRSGIVLIIILIVKEVLVLVFVMVLKAFQYF